MANLLATLGLDADGLGAGAGSEPADSSSDSAKERARCAGAPRRCRDAGTDYARILGFGILGLEQHEAIVANLLAELGLDADGLGAGAGSEPADSSSDLAKERARCDETERHVPAAEGQL